MLYVVQAKLVHAMAATVMLVFQEVHTFLGDYLGILLELLLRMRQETFITDLVTKLRCQDKALQMKI